MPEVLLEREEHLAIVTINRPEAMNALNNPVRRGLIEAFTTFRDDPELWVAIVTGAGDRAFSAGADLIEMSRRRETDTGDPFWETPLPALTKGFDVWKPMIAAINGYCLAGGLELALACDIRIACEGSQFGLTEVTRGIIPGSGGTQRLPRLLPLGAALELLFTGERITAERALSLGLINRIVPKGEHMSAAREMAGRINQNAPLAVRAVKEAAKRGLEVPLDQGLRIEAYLSRIIRDTDDSREGPRAFAEKRPPQFKGR